MLIEIFNKEKKLHMITNLKQKLKNYCALAEVLYVKEDLIENISNYYNYFKKLQF